MNKNVIKSAVLSFVALSSLACTKESGSEESVRRHVTLNAGSASGESAGTKAIFTENVFYWQKNDAVGVQASGSQSLYELALKERSADFKEATFEGDISGNLGDYAVYPYNEGHKISGSTLTYHLPSEYDFSISTLDVDYLDSSENVDSYKTSANPPLLAKITEGDGEGSATCEFKHLGGVLCVKVNDATTSNNFEVIIVADRQICGDFSVDLNSDEPVIKTTSDPTADADVMGTNNYITIKGRVFDYTKGCVCYIPMPVGEYNIKVRFGVSNSPGNGTWYNVSPVKNLQINRCDIKRASITSSTLYKNGGYMLVNGIKYIDLGLPSGKLWATTNVGATLPADYGDLYALSDMTSALGSKKCHIPSDTEFQELIDNTDKEYTSGEKDSSGEGTAGVYFKSKTDDACHIFFPFSGLDEDTGERSKGGVESCSWSSTKTTVGSYDYQKFLSVSLSNGSVSANVNQIFTTYKLAIRPVVTP